MNDARPIQCRDCGKVEMFAGEAQSHLFRCEKCQIRLDLSQPIPPPQFPFGQEKPKAVRVI